MKILNAFAGLGGNRKYWKGKVTAIESNSEVAVEYIKMFPKDLILIGDAYKYIPNHFEEYDIIWASPPCQSYSRLNQINSRIKKKLEPDTRIIGLCNFLVKGKKPFIIENVESKWLRENIPIKPIKIGRHLFFSNLKLNPDMKNVPKFPYRFDKPTDKEFGLSATKTYVNRLEDWLGIHLTKYVYVRGNHDPGQVLRECVHPLIGKYLMKYLTD